MPRGDFGNKRNSKGFDKNKSNINKKGAPKKVLTNLTEYIEKTYGKRPPKGEVLALMEYIECLAVDKLTEFLKDKQIPVIVQAYGRLLLTGDQKEMRRVQGAEMINDRIHGRPKQSTDVTTDGEKLNGLNIIVNSDIIKNELSKLENN
jgi:hypothetical protein